MLRFASLASVVTSASTPGRSGTGTRSSASSVGSGVDAGRLRRAALADVSSARIVERSLPAIAASRVARRPRSDASPARIASRLSTHTSGQIAGLASLRGRLATLETAIASKDRATILSELTAASSARRNLPSSTPDPSELAELRVPVPDRPGVLAEVTAVASEANLNIYDLEIAHSQEGTSGVLIMVLDADAARTLAARLEARGLRTSVEPL